MPFYQKQMILHQNSFFKMLLYHESEETIVHRKTAMDWEPGDPGILRKPLHLPDPVLSYETWVGELDAILSFLL